MKRVFIFGAIVYSALIMLLNDLPFATSYIGTAALPFTLKCLVDGRGALFHKEDDSRDAGILGVAIKLAWKDDEAAN
jgi:hypothetical protein